MALGTIRDSIQNARTAKHDHTAAVVKSEIIVFGGVVMVAVNAAAINTDNVYVYKGKVEFPKKASLAINFMDKVYWDDTAKEINKTPAGNTFCGYCLEDAAAADSTVLIWLEPKIDLVAAGGVTESHVTIAAGNFTTAGGDANETITIAGALATDIAIVTLHTKGSTPVTILTAQAASGQIDVVMSADPSTDHVLNYMLLRAVS